VQSNEESKSKAISSGTRFNRNGRRRSRAGAVQFLHARYVGGTTAKAAEYESRTAQCRNCKKDFSNYERRAGKGCTAGVRHGS